MIDKIKNNSTGQYLTFIAASGENGIEIRYENENIWMTQKMMAELYNVSVAAINQHIKTLTETNEINDAVIKNYLITANDGKNYKTKHYNLQAIISIGFKVENERAIAFRKWAREIVKDYTIQGWSMDVDRLKNAHKFTDEFFERQLSIIREIRASERKFYQKITDIYATSIDYNKDSFVTREFFKTVQNKLHYAVHRHTAAELIVKRANSKEINMGLNTWEDAPDGKIQKYDVSIAKNYLNSKEIDYLNRIVTMYLDYAELQAERKIPMTMEDWKKRLDSFIEFNGEKMLIGPGKVSHEEAKLHTESEYEKYRIKQDKLFISDFDKLLEETKD